jgi:hypothetical protein
MIIPKEILRGLTDNFKAKFRKDRKRKPTKAELAQFKRELKGLAEAEDAPAT